MNKTNGIHHITAITADSQRNLDFYEGFLGQRLVKKTVNFDDPNAYHFYYGDDVGTPGTIITFFYWDGIPKGTRGTSEVESIYYAIAPESLDYWSARAGEHDIECEKATLPFGETVLFIHDPDGMKIGLVAADVENNVVPWTKGPVPEEHVLRGFYGALLVMPEYTPQKPLLEDGLGFELVETKETITRYQATAWPGKFLATMERPDLPRATQGAGSVHHIAFQADTDEVRDSLKSQINEIGIDSTGLVDRQYFHSTYFMTPAMILFEIATNDIGFAIDEEVAELGEHLKLPDQYEDQRSEIESTLTPVTLPRDKDES